VLYEPERKDRGLRKGKLWSGQDEDREVGEKNLRGTLIKKSLNSNPKPSKVKRREKREGAVVVGTSTLATPRRH